MKKILLILLLVMPYTVKAFDTSATSAILYDMDSNRIIYSYNINKVQSVASISKIMTAIIAIESNKLDDIITVGNEIDSSYGSGIYIKEGEELTLRDLIYGLMLRSGNDAALVIATYVGGSIDNFVKMMNDKAKFIGMKNTVFNNPSGLDEKEANFSTVYDMALLTSYTMKNSEYRLITSTKSYLLKTNLNTYKWQNKNKLLNIYKYCTGGKTGYTKIAKRTLVTTASKNEINLVAVTFNDGNDFTDHKELFEEAFSNYKKYSILEKGEINISLDSYYKDKTFYIEDSFSYLLKEEEKDNIVIKFLLEKKKEINDGDKIGTVEIKLFDKSLYKSSVYIKKAEKESIFKKIYRLLTND